MRNNLQQAMNETRNAITQHDASLASEKAENLNKILKEAGVVIYSQQPNAGVYKEQKINEETMGNPPRSSSPHEHVVDADYEENN